MEIVRGVFLKGSGIDVLRPQCSRNGRIWRDHTDAERGPIEQETGPRLGIIHKLSKGDSMNSQVARACAFLLLVILGALSLHAQGMKPLTLEYMLERDSPEGRAQRVSEMQFPAYKVIGNIYYVGEDTHASLLITTPQGHILINSNYERNVPWIRESVEKLGFKFSDIKILLEATRMRITWKAMRW